jgi:hypothetical protein
MPQDSYIQNQEANGTRQACLLLQLKRLVLMTFEGNILKYYKRIIITLWKRVICLSTMWWGREPVAHTCNPSYSGGRDQEDCSSKLFQANSSWDPISKNPISHTHTHTHTHTQRAGGVDWGVRAEFKPQYRKKKCHEHFPLTRSKRTSKWDWK